MIELGSLVLQQRSKAPFQGLPVQSSHPDDGAENTVVSQCRT